MSDCALKLSHIFWEAGTAFAKLSELTRDLHFMNDSQSSCKWNEEEIEMLRACVHRFALDLQHLSQHIKNKTIAQIKRTLRKKAFEDAGVPLHDASTQSEVRTESLDSASFASSASSASPETCNTPTTFTEPDDLSSDSERCAGGGDREASS